LKKVLIVAPHFPPVNAADMHRVRQSLPYFEAFGYQPTVLTVMPKYVEMFQDHFLEQTIPNHVKVYKVPAYPIKYTRMLQLGNLGIRAFYQLYKKGCELLKTQNFDLVYFSTTTFSCMPLGRIWKRKFRVPYVIDMQDPWRNDYYLNVPKSEKPPKFWFAHRLNTLLEAYTIPKMDGLISVSEGYVDMLNKRYPITKSIPFKVLTFGAAEKDFEMLEDLDIQHTVNFDKTKTNIVYIGRGGYDMKDSVSTVFKGFKQLLESNQKAKDCHFWFIGTSPAPEGTGVKTIESIASKFEINDYVTEITDRKPYFEVLALLKSSDIILIPGSNDRHYTASKLYPNILAKKPLLCVAHSNSSMGKIVEDIKAGEVVMFDEDQAETLVKQRLNYLLDHIPFEPSIDWNKFRPYTAKNMTQEQCVFFDRVLLNSKR